MNLRQLRYFTKVIEAESITRASEQLYVAQPALGLQIRQLERNLGVALLVRHARGVTATESGRILYERARTILRLVEDTERELKALGEVSKEAIILGLTPSVMNQVGSDLLIDAREKVPEIFISLVEELSFALVEALEREEIDIALAYDVADRPTLIRRPILTEDIMFVTAPNGGRVEPTITFAGALEHDLVQAGERDLVRRLVQFQAERNSLRMKVVFEAQSISLMKTMVARGKAASFMPFGTSIHEMRAGTLVARRVIDPSIRRTLYLVRRAKSPPFRHEAAIEEVLEAAWRRLMTSLGSLAERVEETKGV